MKPIKTILIGLVLVLAACMPIQTERPADVIIGPVATATILATSTTGTMEPPAEDQPDEPGERVEFEPGTSSIEYNSILPSGLSIKQYVLAAKEGQIMTVNFVSDDVSVSLTLISPSGMLLFSEILQANGSSSGGNVHKLAETGDYLITLTKADHTPSTRYTVEFSIR